MIAGLGVILLAGVLIPNLPIITYILGGILVVSMQSFLNALAFEYSNTGYRINFGFSRAGGSFSYVVTSFTGTAVSDLFCRDFADLGYS